jgi:hypothetical protein
LTLQTYTYEVKALTGELSRKVGQMQLLTDIMCKNLVAMTAMTASQFHAKLISIVTAVRRSTTVLLLIMRLSRVVCAGQHRGRLVCFRTHQQPGKLAVGQQHSVIT